MPKDDETRTWHVHDVDQTWEWGVVCDACRAPKMVPGPIPHFNIKRLQADNLGHYTQRELAREVTDSARRDGRDIMLSR